MNAPRPMMIPPVGKSGPGIIRMISIKDKSGVSINAQHASMTSPKLCVGMDVAIPTAIPEPPLTKRFGKRAGKTVGSTSLSS